MIKRESAMPTEILTEKLKKALVGKEDTEFVDVNISMISDPIALLQQDPAFASPDQNKREQLLKAVENTIRSEQKDLVDNIRPNARNNAVAQLWTCNTVGAVLPITIIKQVATRGDVREIDLNTEIPSDVLFNTAYRNPLKPCPKPPTLSVYFRTHWHLERMKVPEVWKRGLNGDKVIVAVIDSGINYSHPDLIDHMWNHPEYPHHGKNFVEGEDPLDPKDDGNGHGTACASIIAGDGSSGKKDPLRRFPPPLGIASGVKLIAIRIAGFNKKTARGDERKCLEGIEFAIDQNCDIISMSASMPDSLSPDYRKWRSVCTFAWYKGILHVNSAGNTGDKVDCTEYELPHNIGAPANCPPPWIHDEQRIKQPAGGACSVLTCGATDVNDLLQTSSSYGPCEWDIPSFNDYPYQGGKLPGLIKPDLCAPGEAIEVCVSIGSGYSPFPHSNTSAATPCVAGAAALLMQAAKRNPHLTDRAARVMEALSCVPCLMQGLTSLKDNKFGAGRIDVLCAYEMGKQEGWW